MLINQFLIVLAALQYNVYNLVDLFSHRLGIIYDILFTKKCFMFIFGLIWLIDKSILCIITNGSLSYY